MIKRSLLTVAALCLAIDAHAVIFADADWFGILEAGNIPSGQQLLPGASLEASFNFVTDADGSTTFTATPTRYPLDAGVFTSLPGFAPGSDVATSGALKIYLRDPSGNAEVVTILIDNDDPLTYIDIPDFFVFSSGASASFLTDVNADGIVNYSIKSVIGDGQGEFFVDAAFATINVNRPQGVPDSGSAVALLGLALMGLEGLRRKLLAA